MALAAGGRFSSLLTGRAGTRRAEELAAACSKEAATACDPPPQWGAWASGFGGAQWLNADSSTGSAASQQTIGGGALRARHPRRPPTPRGRAARLRRSPSPAAPPNTNRAAAPRPL